MQSHVAKVTKSRSAFSFRMWRSGGGDAEEELVAHPEPHSPVHFHANKTGRNEVNRKGVSRDDCLFMQLQSSPKLQLRSSSPCTAASFSLASGRTRTPNSFYGISLQINWSCCSWNQSLDVLCAVEGGCKETSRLISTVNEMIWGSNHHPPTWLLCN